MVRWVACLLLFLLISNCTLFTKPAPDVTASRALSTPLATPDGSAQTITVALAGGVMLARGVNEMIQEHGPLYPWGDLISLVRKADLFLINLECVIAESGEPFLPPRVFYFRADPQAMQVLAEGGVDYVTLANNHAMDYQGPALLETIRRLDGHGIALSGAGKDVEEAARFALLEARGIKVRVVSFAGAVKEHRYSEFVPTKK